MSNPAFMSVSIVGDRRQIRSLYGKMLQLIQKVYPELEIYFSAEGDGWDAYLTNDKEGRFFKSRFELDMPPENDYHDTIEEVAELIGAYLGRHVEPTQEAVYAAIDEFAETNDDMDAYINLKEFEVVTLSEVM